MAHFLKTFRLGFEPNLNLGFPTQWLRRVPDTMHFESTPSFIFIYKLT